MTNETTVVNINKMSIDEVMALRRGESQYVYIGTEIKHLHLKASKWANKESVGAIVKEHEKAKVRLSVQEARQIANDRYKERVKADKKLMASLPALRGKILVCFCKPSACHGDVLIELLNEMES